MQHELVKSEKHEVKRRYPCFESQEEDEEEVDYVESKMRAGLSQTLNT